MAAGSEKFQWNLFPEDTVRVCWSCGKEPLRVKDVAEHRRVYPIGPHEFRCHDCVKKQIEQAIAKNRADLGLS